MINFIIVAYYIAACFVSCYLNIQVQKNNLPVYATIIGNLLFMFGWMASIKTSNLDLTKLTALVNVTITFGFFFGLAFFGERIIFSQWIGVLFLIAGIILISELPID